MIGLRIAQAGTRTLRVVERISHLHVQFSAVQLFQCLGDGDSRTPVTEAGIGSQNQEARL